MPFFLALPNPVTASSGHWGHKWSVGDVAGVHVGDFYDSRGIMSRWWRDFHCSITESLHPDKLHSKVQSVLTTVVTEVFAAPLKYIDKGVQFFLAHRERD